MGDEAQFHRKPQPGPCKSGAVVWGTLWCIRGEHAHEGVHSIRYGGVPRLSREGKGLRPRACSRQRIRQCWAGVRMVKAQGGVCEAGVWVPPPRQKGCKGAQTLGSEPAHRETLELSLCDVSQAHMLWQQTMGEPLSEGHRGTSPHTGAGKTPRSRLSPPSQPLGSLLQGRPLGGSELSVNEGGAWKFCAQCARTEAPASSPQASRAGWGKDTVTHRNHVLVHAAVEGSAHEHGAHILHVLHADRDRGGG